MKLSQEQVATILAERDAVSARELGRRFGVKHETIRRVLAQHGVAPLRERQPEGQWATVRGFPDYVVSDRGEVWSLRRKVLLSTKVQNPGGYLSVTLDVDGRSSSQLVHRLVLLSFVGEPPEAGMQCAHEDGVVANCALSNLSWKTPKANAADKRRHGTHLEGERAFCARLMDAQVQEIRERRAMGVHGADLAREYGVSPTEIARIVRGKVYRHVETHDVPSYRGEHHVLSKLTDDKVREIRRRAAAGESVRDLGRAFSVHYMTIKSAVDRKTWRHVD